MAIALGGGESVGAAAGDGDALSVVDEFGADERRGDEGFDAEDFAMRHGYDTPIH